MYYTVPSKNKQICHQKDSTQKVIKKYAGHMSKILAQV